MRRYDKEKLPDYFAQGFRLGLVFGVIGALIILGRDASPEQTMLESGTNAQPSMLGSNSTLPKVEEVETETESASILRTAIEAPPPIAQG